MLSALKDWIVKFLPQQPAVPQIGLQGNEFEINPAPDANATQKRNIARLGRLVIALDDPRARTGELTAEIVRHVAMITGGAVQLSTDHLDIEVVRDLLEHLQGSKE